VLLNEIGVEDGAVVTCMQLAKLCNATADLRADRNFVLSVVADDGYELEYASEDLKADREIVLKAVQNFYGSLSCASEELRADREIVLAAVSQNQQNTEGTDLLFWASDALKNDPEVVLLAVQNCGDGGAFESASNKMKEDFDIALAAVSVDGNQLQYASDELRSGLCVFNVLS
jgi:hypothetical protein